MDVLNGEWRVIGAHDERLGHMVMWRGVSLRNLACVMLFIISHNKDSIMTNQIYIVWLRSLFLRNKKKTEVFLCFDKNV